MASEKVPMLAEGHRHLNDELRRLKIEERPAIIEAIEEAEAGMEQTARLNPSG